MGAESLHPAATERLHEYWVHGEGAAKIAWGTPGDFDRCVAHLSQYIHDPQGYCNLAHHSALGYYPATHAKMLGRSEGLMPTREDLLRADTQPYGDVAYADPGYQADGKKRYPIDSKEHCMAAWSYINQAGNAAKYSAEHLASIKSKIKAAGSKFGITFEDTAHRGKDLSDVYQPKPFVRSFALQDISIRAGGDGRTVDAYATVFDTPTPIHDQDGDYIEVIDRKAFDRILPKLAPSGGRTSWRVGVFYNHGMTLHGTPSDMDSMPIGVPLDIKADGHGLFTRTRYHAGERADMVLEAIREGSIAGYSFSGRFDRSTPPSTRGGYRPDRAGNLPTVRRTESTLREYGPTPFPAYPDAAITAVRAEKISEQLEQITELLRSGGTLPDFDPADLPLLSGAPTWDSPPEDSHTVRSGRSVKEEIAARRSAFLQRYGSEHA